VADDGDTSLIGGSPSLDLASNRTALAFERTRMASDRTLMAIVRTALSLISFGFTIFQFLRKFAQATGGAVTVESARNFGLSLIVLGVFILVAGLLAHFSALRRLGGRRDRLHELKLMRRAEEYRTSPTVVTAIALLAIGLLAVAGMMSRAGPFG
jgi:putative membrane protein